MSLSAIIQEIESRAGTREIGRLQEIRRELKKHARPAGHSIFSRQSTFQNGDFPYAFHHGGRTELQFNMGFEPGGFRHGVAFSFEASQSVPQPEITLIPSVKRFNEYLTLYPQQFADMSMWHWEGKKERRGSAHTPSSIQSDLIRPGVFVFMGRMQPIDAIDYELILDDFDLLLPLYRFVEGRFAFPTTIDPSRGAGFQFKPGCTLKPVGTTGTLQDRELNITLRHNEVQKALHDHLASIFGTDDVATESECAGGRVDVAVRRSKTFWFYEIKTCISARACIRQALAQLLEYSFWTGGQEAEKLVIVGEASLDADAELYLTTLRKRFYLPIEYQQFDMARGGLTPLSDGSAITAVLNT